MFSLSPLTVFFIVLGLSILFFIYIGVVHTRKQMNRAYVQYAVAHIAGRTLIAWVDEAVTSVNGARADIDNEKVELFWDKSVGQPELAWHHLLVLVAGSAGETAVHDGQLRHDVNIPLYGAARGVAETILQKGNPTPPWPTDYDLSFNAAAMYGEDAESLFNRGSKEIVDACFERARPLIEQHQIAFNRLLAELTKKGTLSKDELNTLLGVLI